jgi:signal transduction histidine kinase
MRTRIDFAVGRLRIPRGLMRAWGRLSLLTRFTLVALSLTILIGLALGSALASQLERSALQQEAASAADEVTFVLGPVLQAADFEGPPSAERYATIDRLVRERILDTQIVRVKIWNRSGLEAYSNNPSAVGQSFPVSDELAQALMGNFATEISDLSKAENRTERGSYARLMEVYVPIRLGGDEVVGAYEIYHDLDVVTPRILETQRFLWVSLVVGFGVLYLALFDIVRRASQELHRQNQELAKVEARREMDRLKSEFVAIVSHELRTPLTALVGFADLLRVEGGDEAERREWTEMLHEGAERLAHLVEELLDVSRIEEGRVELRCQTVDVRSAVESVVATFRGRRTERAIERRYDEPLPPTLADPEKLAQVLTNLISNAFKYSPRGGSVSIAVAAEDGAVHFRVSDTGLGIPASELPLVFERFHRIEDETRQDIEGSGLGLYITKQLVELQGGRVWAESPGPNKGSTFHVTLPAARADVATGSAIDVEQGPEVEVVHA